MSDTSIAIALVDSGASEQAVNERYLFQTIRPIEPIELELSDGYTEKAKEKETDLAK